ncbi:MAG: acyl transferase [Flavipsychrobacter sp.]
MLNINDISVYDYINSINEDNFDEIALQVYNLQISKNKLYGDYTDLVNAKVSKIEDVPFLPISFFKTHHVCLEGYNNFVRVFESSGTTNQALKSKHFISNTDIYNASSLKGFTYFFGDPKEYVFLALLPSYLERGNSSLVYMVNMLMQSSNQEEGGFYLNEYEKLASILQQLAKERKKVILFGVTFALLDFATTYPFHMDNVIVIETGGMKGRGKELTREEVHQQLTTSWGIDSVHSEYGMTELLSQAYSKGNGIYKPSKTMKVLVRDINDPLVNHTDGVGILNIIDLANLYSCSFIETEDIGKVYADGSFEVLGRLDNTALRGCSLMAV